MTARDETPDVREAIPCNAEGIAHPAHEWDFGSGEAFWCEGDETPDWTVGVVAQTVSGEVVLRMTSDQADELRETLLWLTGDDE